MVKLTNTKLLTPFLMIFIILNLIAFLGCGGSIDKPTSSSGGSTVPPPVVATPASIKLSANPISVKSDDSSTSTITATALDANNAAINGLTVTFSSTGGKLSSSSAVTDANGKAQIAFSSGAIDQTNRVVMITGVAGSLSSQIPLTISGSTIALTTTTANLTSGSSTATLTIVAKDASGTPVYNAPITLSVPAAQAGIISLSRTTGNTDTDGKLTATVTAGVTSGTATVTIAGLGFTATQDYLVTPIASTFRITFPTSDPASIATNTPLTITVNATGVANVVFASTIGTWNGGASSIVTVPVAEGTASATLSSTLAGIATVQVSDAAIPTTTAFIGVAVFAPVADAANLVLQADKSVVGLSVGGVFKTAQLFADVTNASHQPVGNAAVQFSILNPTGGGESISPVVAYTDATGRATATFTSGSKSSSAVGVTVLARVVSAPAVTGTKNIVIGGTAGSVAIAYGTDIVVENATTYQLPMAVQVADSNGNAVADAVVTLAVWPTQYSAGVWWYSYKPDNSKEWHIYRPVGYTNEDINENMILEPGEDTNYNGQLDPPNSAGGTTPGTVTTDANGVATFNLEYLKSYAWWLAVRVRATTKVLGTETTSYIMFTLPVSTTEVDSGKLPTAIPASNFNVELNGAAGSAVTQVFWNPGDTTTTYSSQKQGQGATLVVNSTTDNANTGCTYSYTIPAGTPIGTVIWDSVNIKVSTSGAEVLGPQGIPVRIYVR
jgi:hypothetical protein